MKSKMVKKTNKNKGAQSRKTRQPRLRNSPTIKKKDWLQTMIEPFESTAIQIPDDQTTQSGVVTSRYATLTAPPAGTGTSSLHTFGIVVYPFPQGGIFTLNEVTAGGAVLTDLNSAGNSFISRTAWPNVATIATDGYNARCVSMGIRLTYEGTELNRAGRIYGGTIPVLYDAISTGSVLLSPVSTLVNVSAQDAGSFLTNMSNRTESRVGDNTYEVHWVPSSIPTYQKMNNTPGEMLTLISDGIGESKTPSFWSAPYGAAGCQTGQNALIVIVEGDVTSAASASPNRYALEVVAHWEIVPSSPYAVVYDLNPSNFIIAELVRALNHIGAIPSGRILQANSTTLTRHDRSGQSGNYADYLTVDNMKGAYRMITELMKVVAYVQPNNARNRLTYT